MLICLMGFLGLTTTVRASKATGISKYLMPASAQILHFLPGNRARGVGNVDLAAAEFLEAAAGT